MTAISNFLSAFLLMILFSSCVAAESLMPAVAFLLSYACFKLVFCKENSSEELYDPVDFY